MTSEKHGSDLIGKGEAKLSFDKQRRGEVLTRNERQWHCRVQSGGAMQRNGID